MGLSHVLFDIAFNPRLSITTIPSEKLEGYDDPSTTLERWQRWVAVRDAVAPVKHAERYYDDQVLYHYNCQTAGSERTRIRDGLRAYRKKV